MSEVPIPAILTNMNQSLRPQARNKHRAGVFGFLEAAVLVEGEFLVIGDHDDAEVILVLFVDLVDEDFPDALALIFGAHEQVMHVGVHDAVVHGADHADEFVAVPCGDDSLEVLHRNDELIREMSRRPFNRKEQVLQILFREVVYFFVFDAHIFFDREMPGRGRA